MKRFRWILYVVLPVVVLGSIIGIYVAHALAFRPDWYSNGIEQTFISEESVWINADGKYTMHFSAERACGVLFYQNQEAPICLYFYEGRMGAPEFYLKPFGAEDTSGNTSDSADVLARGVWRYDENTDAIILTVDNIYDCSYGDLMKGTVFGDWGTDTLHFVRTVQNGEETPGEM